MRFYDRIDELTLLTRTEELAQTTAQMTFVVGKRRIGKTSLLIKATENSKALYFFVAKKNEILLCSEFVEQIRQNFDTPLFGEIKTFKELFAFIMELSKNHHFTLIIDEFQEFFSVNPAIFSEMQHLWDSNKQNSQLNLVLCGSVYTLMSNIF